jgi:hypothetical protein
MNPLESWAIETRIFERYVQEAGAPLKILVSKSYHFSFSCARLWGLFPGINADLTTVWYILATLR